jgi:hypothetical protein
MANPPRQKGTTEETAIVNEWNNYFAAFEVEHVARRMPAGARYDIEVDGFEWGDRSPIEVLSTRSDRGERLVTLRFADFMDLYGIGKEPPVLHIEAKRYARTAIGTIFEKKFGRKR